MVSVIRDKAMVSNAVLTKTPNESRSTKERNCWVIIDGIALFRITVPHGRGELPTGTANKIYNQSKIGSKEDYNKWVKCKISITGYEKIIRARIAEGLI